MMKNKKGISLTTMVITVLIMLIIMGTLIYSASDSVKIRKINKLYEDLRNLNDVVEIYYLKNGELPVDTEKEGITISSSQEIKDSKIGFVLKNNVTTVNDQNDFLNPNDYDNNSATYKFLKLGLLENLSLNYPDNEYIINTKSHTIYSYTGLKIDDKTYNSLPIKYIDTEHSEILSTSSIRMKNVIGISNPASNTVYFSTNNEKINLKDLLEFDSAENDGKGEPESVTFSMESESKYYTIDENTGVLSRKSQIMNVSNFSSDYNSTVTACAKNYGSDETESISFTVSTCSINMYPDDEKNSEPIEYVNLVKKQDNPIYVYEKSEEKCKLEKNGALNNKNDIMLLENSEDTEIASANYDGSQVTYKSGEKAGSTDVTLEVQDYGLAKDTVTVNVFNFQIYEGSAGSNTNIEKLDFGGIGDDQKTNVKLNVEGPNELKFDGIKSKVEWSIVKDDKSEDDSGIVDLTQDSDDTKATIIPKKVGKTNLRCIVTVENEKLVEMLVPIFVSGIEREDNVDIIDDTISLKVGEEAINLKYVFGNPSISDYILENPIITPSSDFIVTKNDNDTFKVKYIGTSSETSGILTIVVKVGEEEYKDTMNFVVRN